VLSMKNIRKAYLKKLKKKFLFRCLSAMKCLANWPMSTLNMDETNFPNYRGFEMDVFSVVKDYFIGLR